MDIIDYLLRPTTTSYQMETTIAALDDDDLGDLAEKMDRYYGDDDSLATGLAQDLIANEIARRRREERKNWPMTPRKIVEELLDIPTSNPRVERICMATLLADLDLTDGDLARLAKKINKMDRNLAVELAQDVIAVEIACRRSE